jgi:4a-hydroxytetrahydrobiopterin dehydratase
MTVLENAEIQAKLALIPNWQLSEGEIVREFVFTDFVAAMKFVNRVADSAEKAGHHPNIDIRWNKVRLALSSHDAGGITEADFSLASTIASLFPE